MIEKLLFDSSAPEPEKPKKGAQRILIRDVRIFINTINKAVSTMKQAGIDAVCKHKDSGEYIEYTVRIPKTQTERSA